jgi:gamma-glutamylputrescine oxidase
MWPSRVRRRKPLLLRILLENCVRQRVETIAGNRDRLKLLEELKVPAFPGGRTFRAPLLFLALSWYALMDRI